MNIICDVAGQWDTFHKLMLKMPPDDLVLVGDIVDRGPDSRQMIEYCMAQDPAITDVLMGNHEHMMIDFLEQTHIYDTGLWITYNGGRATMKSYGAKEDMSIGEVMNLVPKEHLVWLKSRPLFLEKTEGDRTFLITHGPLHAFMSMEASLVIERKGLLNDQSVIWNRSEPKKLEGVTQVFGHNSPWGFREFSDEGDDKPWAYCLDTTASRILTGLNTKEMKIYTEDYPAIRNV